MRAPPEMKAPTPSEWLRNLLFRRFGIVGIFVAGVGSVLLYVAIHIVFPLWSNWSSARAWPGVPALIAGWKTEPISKANPKRYAIVVADLVDDPGQEHSTLLVTLLREFPGFQVIPIHRTISLPAGSDSDAQEAAAHRVAVKYLEESGASILIWGSLLRLGDKTQPQLRITTDSAGPAPAHQYDFETPSRLPTPLWNTLATTLSMVIDAEYTHIQAGSNHGQLSAAELRSFIDRLGFLLSAVDEKFGWHPTLASEMRIHLGDAFRLYGEQANERGSIERALIHYRVAAIAYSPEKTPAEWARLQNKRASAQMDLAVGSTDPTYLHAAMSTLRDTLALSSGDRAEREVWNTRASLGLALIHLSEIERDPRRAEEAIAEFRAALNEPRPWYSGVTDHGFMLSGLGRALTVAGEHDAQPARLREAIGILERASNDLPPRLAPRMFAAAQVHLGAALLELGDRESDRDLLGRAVAAYENAMKYVDRNPDKLDWTVAAEGRCLARMRLGSLDREAPFIRECLAPLQEVVSIRARAGATLEKAHGMLNLGTAYSSLARLERSAELFRQAVSVETEALQELKRTGLPDQEAIAENNIGAALLQLGRLEHDPSLLQESVSALQSALQKRCRVPSSADCASARATLVKARKALATSSVRR